MVNATLKIGTLIASSKDISMHWNADRGVDALPCFRNGHYSRTFGRWCGSKPAAVRDQILQHLDTLKGIRGVEELKARVADGNSGETMVLINACKCMHVIKNWVFLKRSSST